jgi:hypothetical protein
MAGVARPDATPAEIREAVNPHLPTLIDNAIQLMISAGRRLPELNEAARQRLSCLLMRSCRRKIRRDEIFELPILPVFEPGRPETRLISLAETDNIARDRAGVVVSVRPEEVRGRGPKATAPVLVLANEERGLITDLLDVTIEPPPRRRRGALLRRVAAGLRAAVTSVLGRARGPFAGGVVPDDELLEAERSLLAELDRHVEPPLEVRLCAGRGRVRRHGQRLLLPRNDPMVAGSVRLAAADERWLYPVATALLGRWVAPGSHLRARWMRHELS